jgi:hypothetical protein
MIATVFTHPLSKDFRSYLVAAQECCISCPKVSGLSISEAEARLEKKTPIVGFTF